MGVVSEGIGCNVKNGLLYASVLCLLLSSIQAMGVEEKYLGDDSDGSLAGAVHRINLIDEEGEEITAASEPLMPFSMRNTCGACHNYEAIGGGWHFNAVDANVAAGRSGEPWILADAATATVVPLSYRSWPGVFRPDELGLSTWRFSELFGKHIPGGGPGEIESDNVDEVMRGFVSGKLEINCLACHNGHPGHDQGEYAIQIARQNFRWAATGSCGFASMTGSARSMPDTYDPLMPEVFDNPKQVPPQVKYAENIFGDKNKVLFEIVREVPAERCYFCHSHKDVDESRPERWMADEDVHLTAGLTCVDCHRVGYEHNTVRGYEGEEEDSNNPFAGAMTCKGCHIDGKSSSSPRAGRLGAPFPRHSAIAPVHFEVLTCTACHSGAWPEKETYHTRTSKAHSLGTRWAKRSGEALPHIQYPVFAKQGDGKIGPHKMIWPAFWGTLVGEDVSPVALETVEFAAGEVIGEVNVPDSGDWLAFSDEQIVEMLGQLKEEDGEGAPVYVSGGRVYRLDEQAALVSAEHEAGKPYLWPVAHNVRPASQSMGVRGCADCHTADGAFFFGEVAIDTAVVSAQGAVKEMFEFEGVDATYVRLFSYSFVFRPWLKVIGFGSSAILGVVLLYFLLRALSVAAKMLGGKE